MPGAIPDSQCRADQYICFLTRHQPASMLLSSKQAKTQQRRGLLAFITAFYHLQ